MDGGVGELWHDATAEYGALNAAARAEWERTTAVGRYGTDAGGAAFSSTAHQPRFLAGLRTLGVVAVTYATDVNEATWQMVGSRRDVTFVCIAGVPGDGGLLHPAGGADEAAARAGRLDVPWLQLLVRADGAFKGVTGALNTDWLSDGAGVSLQRPQERGYFTVEEVVADGGAGAAVRCCAGA